MTTFSFLDELIIPLITKVMVLLQFFGSTVVKICLCRTRDSNLRDSTYIFVDSVQEKRESFAGFSARGAVCGMQFLFYCQ